jgi:8-oxo-dGTP pyrophosphatase MutT (NUDIX family)
MPFHKKVAIALIPDPDSQFCLGYRKDAQAWSFPGGHLDEGEDPYAAVCREVKEEVGLEVTNAKLVMAGTNKAGIMLYLFVCKTEGQIDCSQDPDEEFEYAEYCDPWDHLENLYIPVQKNIAIKYLASLI